MCKENISEKKKFTMPHIFIILYAIILLVGLLSYVLPAGVYDRVADATTGRMIINPTSYHVVKSNPTGVMDLLEAFPNGFVDAGYVVVLTFCVCGGFYVVNQSGAIGGAISWLAKKMKNRGIWIIPILMITFAAIDCFIGMCELCMVYVPIILPLMLALGFDSMTACATALCGSAIGFTSAIANPFTTIIGQKIAGLPLLSGWQLRLISLIVVGLAGIVYVMSYAAKVKKDPTSSIMYEEDLVLRKELETASNQEKKMTGRQKLAGIAALVMFVIMVYGVFQWGWDTPEIGGIFMGMAMVSGLISGMNPNEICSTFLNGCQQVLLGALIVGLSRGVSVVMSSAQITDTIIHNLATVLQNLPASVTSVGMLIVQTIMNFLIPSGSGQTVVTMPIMAPLSDLVGVTRQTAVLALQYGDGFSNIFYPVSGYFMATLALGHVPYGKWMKKMAPLFVIWTALAAVFMVIAQLIKWGPF
ncbi:C4-dicarboxylate ABC transporter [Pyramidobacter piscolens]|uniref:YfcC family protein n=2 Tax=Pyramidobacter piscolens TaxID=638849 RepID=UPI0024902707|nr:TIGR00366 family protein [Pyramidobacter piscolens]BDF77632.1 C4-dicarboxylate ABC transporter [Pyramidobacter piscolens]